MLLQDFNRRLWIGGGGGGGIAHGIFDRVAPVPESTQF